MPVNPKGKRTAKTQANNRKRAMARIRLSYPQLSRIYQSPAVMNLAPKYRLSAGRRCQAHLSKIPRNVMLTGVGADKYRCKRLAVYHYESVNGGGMDLCGTHVYSGFSCTIEDAEASSRWEDDNQALGDLILKEEGVDVFYEGV